MSINSRQIAAKYAGCHESSVATQLQNRGAVATGSKARPAQLMMCHSITEPRSGSDRVQGALLHYQDVLLNRG